MRKCPIRSYDPSILQEPHIYRMNEVCGHYGEAILAVIHEQFGDGIMSAIDFKFSIGKIKGDHSEKIIMEKGRELLDDTNLAYFPENKLLSI
ncbi:hypothetical protein [Nitrosococcus wardiae]|uniref:Cyanate lyase C-terminal domain-containing protein n=1 Tax=Nitrosococcus wardiae TaxID=1814290 RepID=A0A4P7C2Q2_9GAMM|nr:hypothetical protein [Nitrosococcus wardiae]QBQ56019.1 hypothetical protein E3U44_17015 [Nitrosococcus wardiae]